MSNLITMIILTCMMKFCIGGTNYFLKITEQFDTIQRASFVDPHNGTNFLLDSKIQETKMAFLSSNILQANYYPNTVEDKMLHLKILDFSNSFTILFNNFFKISSIPLLNTQSCRIYTSKILNVDPLILYINYSQII